MSDLEGVLLLDHDAVRRVAFAARLRAVGVICETSATATDALARLSRRDGPSPVVALIIAGDLPGMGAALLVRAARSIPGYAQVPLILVGGGPTQGNDPPLSVRVPDADAALLRQVLLDQMAVGGAASSTAVAPVASSGRVLVVDDNEVNRLILQRIVEDCGIGAETAVDGIDAVAKAGKERFALVFMDCEMPRMDGFEATRAIRRLDSQRGGHTPVVACTARNLPGDREAGFASGMDEYLVKPVPANQIEAQIRRWVQGVRPRPVRTPSVPVSARLASVVSAAPAASTGRQEDPLLEREVIDRIRSYGGDVLERTTTMFLTELDERIRELRNLDQSANLDELAKRAHALKGAAGSLGAKRLWQRLAKLEALAKARDVAACSGLCADLVAVANETTAAMRAYLKPA